MVPEPCRLIGTPIHRGKKMMRIILIVVSILMLLAGAVWFLQGINVIGGSVMTGQSQWEVIGAIVFIAGIVLLVLSTRRRASSPQKPK
jgi:uncharacterized membrane protein SirB2